MIIWSDFAILYREDTSRQEVAIFLNFSPFTYSSLRYDNDKDGVLAGYRINEKR